MSLNRQNNRSRNGVRYTETAAKVFQRIAERIQRRDHVRACVRERFHVGPFGDDAISALAGLYDVSVFDAGLADVPVCVDKILIAARLHPEAYRVECSHDLLPFLRQIRIASLPRRAIISSSRAATSAKGQKPTSDPTNVRSALPPTDDIANAARDVG